MGSYIWTTGTSGGWGTIANWSGPGFPDSASADATINAAGTYTVTLEAGATDTVDSVTLNNASAILDVAGTLDLAGTLALVDLAAGTLAVAGLISGSNVSIGGGATLEALGGTIESNNFSFAGSGYINLNGSSLTIGGTTTIQGYVTGPGELVLSGVNYLNDDPYFEAGVTVVDTGTIDLTSNAQFGVGGGTLTALSIASGATFNVSGGQNLQNDGTSAITNAGLFESTFNGGTVSVGEGFTNASGGTLAVGGGVDDFTGATDSFGGTITGTGALEIGGGGNAVLASGLVLNVATFGLSPNYGDSATVSLSGNFGYAGDFDMGARGFDTGGGGVVDLDGHTLTLSGFAGLGGQIFGPGELVVSNDGDIGSGNNSGGSGISGGATVAVTGTLTDDATEQLGYSATDSALLSIASTGTFNLIDDGAINAQGTAAIVNAGLFEKTADNGTNNIYAGVTNTGTLDVARGGIDLFGAADSLAGTVNGAGAITIGNGGSVSLVSGLVLTVATLGIDSSGYGDAGTAGLGANLSYAGTLEENARGFDTGGGGTIDLNGHTLTLSGYAGLNGQLAGPGTVVTSGRGDLGSGSNSGGSGLTGGAVLDVTGTMTQDGQETLGYTATDTAEITVGSTGTFDVLNGSGISADGTVSIVNAGLFEKTGGDLASTIAPNFTNTGTVAILTGALDFSSVANSAVVTISNGEFLAGGAVSGTGTFKLGAYATAAFEGAVAATQAISMTGSGDVLALGDPSAFAGTINGFVAGDTIDLTGIAANGFSYAGNTLTLTETPLGGSTTIIGKLDIPALANSASLTLLLDGSGGTDIELLSPSGTEVPTGSITTDTWTAAGSGTWGTGGNWSNNAAPGIANIAYFSSGLGAITVTDTSTGTINSIQQQDSGLVFEQTSGTLSVLAGGIFYGAVDQTGGEIAAIGDGLGFDAGGTFAGTLGGPSAIDLNYGTFTLDAGAVLSATTIQLDLPESAFAEILLAANQTYAGSFGSGQDYNGGEINLNGFTFDLSGQDVLAGQLVAGPGTLLAASHALIAGVSVTGGAVIDDTGTITESGGSLGLGTYATDTATLTIAAHAVYDLADDYGIAANGTVAIVNAGLFEKTADNGGSAINAPFTNASTGTIDAAIGTLQMNGGGTLAGTLEGAGVIAFNGGVTTLAAGVVLNVATISLPYTGFSYSTIVLGGSQSFAGALINGGNGGDINLNGFNLTLSGAAGLGGETITGPGTLDLTGSGDLGGTTVDNGAVLLVAKGTYTQDGALTLGDSSTDTSAATIASGVTYDLLNDSTIYANGTTSLTNDGLFVKTADYGTSVIEPSFTNASTGTISIALGALQFDNGGSFAGHLTGGGIDNTGGGVNFNGGTVVFNTAAVAALDYINLNFGTLDLAGTVTTDAFNINNNGAELVLENSRSIGGEFSAVQYSDIDLNGFNLTLTGTGAVRADVFGAGTVRQTLALAGSFDIGNLSISSDLTELVTGTAVQDGGSELDFDDGSLASILSVASTGTYDIVSPNQNFSYNGTLGTIINAGLFENTSLPSLGYYINIYNDFTQTSTGTLFSGPGENFSFYGPNNDLSGTADGNYLYFGAGTTTLESALTLDPGGIGVGGNATLLFEGNRSIGNEFDATYSSDLDLNGDAVTLSGSGSVRGYVYGGGTLDIAGSILVGGLYLASGTEELVTGTAVQDGQNRLDFDNGTQPSILSITSTGTYDYTAVNTSLDYNGATGTIINAGLFENGSTAASYFNVYDNFTNSSTGTLNVGAFSVNFSTNISLYGANNLLGGTINGPGQLLLAAGTTTLAAGVNMDPGLFAIGYNGATAIMEGNLTPGQSFNINGPGTLDLNGFALTLDQTGDLAGTIYGPGTVDVSGTYYVGGLQLGSGITEVLSGVEIQNAEARFDSDGGTVTGTILSITSTGTYDITAYANLDDYQNYDNYGTIINAGLFEKTGYSEFSGQDYTNAYQYFTQTSTGTMVIDADNDLSFGGQTTDLNGTIDGPGYLYFFNGSQDTLEAGLVINNLAQLTVSDNNTQLILESNRTIASAFAEINSATLNLNGDVLTLAGKGGNLSGYLTGPGTLNVTGSDVEAEYLYGGVSEVISGSEAQTNTSWIDYGAASAVTALSITSTGTYDILNDTPIYNGNNNGAGSGTIINAGLFEKTGGPGGVSDIYAPITNTGTILAAIGTIRLDDGGTLGGTLAGAGTLDLNGGTFTLAANAVLSVANLDVTASELILSANTTYSGAFSLNNNATVDLNGFNLALNNPADYLSAYYVLGAGTLSEAGRVDLNNFYLSDGAVLADLGTITQDGGFTMGTAGGDSATLTIAAGAVFDTVNDYGIGTGGANATINNAGLFDKTADNGGLNIYAAFNNAATGTLDATYGYIQLNGGGSLAGTLTGGGVIYLNQYYAAEAYTLGSAAVVNVATFDLNGATLDLAASRSLTDVFDATAGTIALNGFNLTLTGADTLNAAYVAGAGTLDVTGSTFLENFYVIGGAELLDAGTITEDISNLNLGANSTDTATLSIASGGVYNFISDNYIYANGAATINNAGLYEKTAATGISYTDAVFNNTGTVNAALGTLELAGGGSLAGTLEGAGVVDLVGGVFLLQSAAVVSVTNLDVAGATLDLLGSRAYAGTFAQSGGSLSLAGHVLTLSGSGYLDSSYESGTGTLDAAGTFDVFNYNVSGGAVLLDAKTITMDGGLQLGETSTDSASLSIASTGTFNILNDSYIQTDGAVTIANAGLFEKTGEQIYGNYLSVIEGNFTNTGTIAALSGILQEQTLTNDGTVTIANATDQILNSLTANTGDTGKFLLGGGATLYEGAGMASSQSITLSGTNNIVEINNVGSFAATISSFAATDTIDLLNIVANSLTYVGSELTLKENGTVVASLAVAGIANAGSLGLTSDNAGGTDITFSNPGTITQPNGSVVTDTWTVTAGDFNTAANWSLGVPGTLSTAYIPGSAGAATITDSGSDKIYQLSGQDSSATFAPSAGTLTVIDGGVWDGPLLQTGGEILNQSGTLQFTNAGTIAGTLAGGGEIALGANNVVDTLAATAVLSVATLALEQSATLALAGNQSFSGTFNTGTYTTTDLNGHNLSLTGTAILNYDATVAGAGTLDLAGTSDIFYFTVENGAVLDVTGDATLVGYNLYLGDSSADTSALSVAAAATFDLSDYPNIYGQGTASTVYNAGLLEKIDIANASNIQSVSFTQASTGTVESGRGVLNFYGDNAAIAGTLAGAGEILLQYSTASIASGAVLSVGSLEFYGSDITLGGPETYAGSLGLTGGGTLSLGANLLDLTGTASLDNMTVAGTGTLKVASSAEMGGLALTGAEQLLDAGTIVEDFSNLTLGETATDTTSLLIAAGAVYNIVDSSGIAESGGTATITNAGLFEKSADNGNTYIDPIFDNASTGTLDVAVGTLIVQYGGSFAGTVEGAGELNLQNYGAPYTLASTAVVSVATIATSGTLIVASSRTYAGAFTQSSTLELGTYALSLTGNASLAGVIDGGSLIVAKTADLDGTQLTQNAVLADHGTITQDGAVYLGGSSTDSTSITIAAGAIYDLLTDTQIEAYQGTSAINNAGLFEKTNDYGTDSIGPGFTNASTGTIDVVRGFMDFTGGSFAGTIEGGTDGTISDGGVFQTGGTLTLASAAVVTVAELGLSGGDLLLGGSRTYAGSFSGSGGGTLSLNSDTFSVTSPYLGNFYLDGAGTMNVAGTSTLSGLVEFGGAVLIDKGTIIETGNLQIGNVSTDASEFSIASGAVLDSVNDSAIYGNGTVGVVNAGLFEKTADTGITYLEGNFTNLSTGIIDAAVGTLNFYSGAQVLGGTLEGAGEIVIDNNTTLTSSVVTVATLDVANYPTFASNLTYGGDFILNYNDTATLTSTTLVLTGTADLVGGFQGPGSVTIAAGASAQIDLADLFGRVTLVDAGFINQTEELRFGLNDGSSDTLSITSIGTYDIQQDSNFHNYGNAASVDIAINAGLLEKTGDTGLSELQVTLTNTGTVLVDSGTLQTDTLTNLAAGTLTGGTWVVDAGLLGPTLALQGGAVAVDAAAITLSGAGSDIYGAGTLLEASLTSVATGGILSLLGGRGFAAGQIITDAGHILLEGGTLATPGLTVAAGGSLSGNGTVTGAITDNGQIEVTDPTLTLAGSLSGTGGVLIDPNSTLILGAGAASGTSITFGGSLDVLALDTPAAVLSKLVSLAPSDTIDLVSLAASSATIAGGDLIVSLTGGGTLSYSLSSAYALDRAAAHSDGHGGTDITIFGEAVAGSIAPTPVNFGQHHAGSALTQTYTIANTAPAGAYTEYLDATMGSASAVVIDSGSFAGLTPGSTNSSSLKATLVTSTGGLISGTATVNLYTDGTSVPGDGLGSLSIGTETVSLTGTIFNYATASTASPNPVSFGQKHVGAALVQDLTLKNGAVAGAYSENLDASFSGTSSDLAATGSISELTAGATNSTSLVLTLASALAGVETGTTTLGLVSDGSGIDTLGTTKLASQTITATTTLFNYATATATPHGAGLEAHVGGTLTQFVTIANAAAAGIYSENLDAKISGTSTDLTSSGTVSELAAGSTNSTSLALTLNSGAAGTESGTATLGLISDGSGIDTLGTTTLANQTVTVTGTLFSYATAVATPHGAGVEGHVGSALTQFITIANSAAAGIYSENLDASVSGTSSNLTHSGTVSELAAGATNNSSLGLTLGSGTAGVNSGTVVLGLISDGLGIDTLGTTTLASQTVTVAGTLFNYATATATPHAAGLEAHAGSALTQFVTIANSGAAGAYTENLDAGFSGTSADLTGSGTVSELAAGASNSTSLALTLGNGTAGVNSGTAVLGLISDGSGIDTLGTTTLASQTVTVTGTLFNYATAVATPHGAGLEGHVGSALTQFVTIANAAAAGIYSENLDASFSGTSTNLTHSGAVSELAAGATNNTSLGLTLGGGTAGVNSGTAVLGLISDGSGIDTLGTTTLASQTVSVSGTLFNYATASALSAVSFGEKHVGTALTKHLTIANQAAAGIYSENLDAKFSGTSSDITTSGSVSELAAGGSNTALVLTLASGTAGVQTGSATIGLVSDGSTIDTLGTTTLAGQTVAVSGTLFNYATAATATPVSFGIVHVGQAVTKYIALSNTAAAGSYSEKLNASLSGTSSDFTTSGTISGLAAGATSTTNLHVTIATGTAGVESGTTTLGLVSSGAGIDTLGTTVLAGETVVLTGTVNNYATATIETISGPGVLSGSGTSYSLNLGSVTKGHTALKENIGILNSATGPADSLSGSLSLSGTTGFKNSGDAAFSGKAAGQADTSPIITLTTGTLGTFTETIVIHAKGTNASGYSGTLAAETLTVTGTVVAAAAVVPASDAATIAASPTAMAFATPAVAGTASKSAAPLTGTDAAAKVPALGTPMATHATPSWASAFASHADNSLAAVSPTSAVAGVISPFRLNGEIAKPTVLAEARTAGFARSW